jgi:hypothetical protein
VQSADCSPLSADRQRNLSGVPRRSLEIEYGNISSRPRSSDWAGASADGVRRYGTDQDKPLCTDHAAIWARLV